jgi:hypothetical protein
MRHSRTRVTTRLAKDLRPLISQVSKDAAQRPNTIDHGSLLGLTDDDHTGYLLASGARDVAGNLLPDATDTRDLGSSTRLWRKGWLSELDAVLFAENTVTVIGGWLLIGKNEGAFPADVTNAAATIDFGKAMTPNDFVLCRAAGAVEYLQVGTLVSGTTYNVTRNLDGTGANAWPAGSVFVVLGNTGDGRIELNAYDTPRISIIEQGATYNAQTERVRIGDLNGSFGISSELHGFAAGNYAGGNYLRYDPTNGFVIKAVGGAITLDENGLAIENNTDIGWYSGGSKILGITGGIEDSEQYIDVNNGFNYFTIIGDTWAAGKAKFTGSYRYGGDLISFKNNTEYTVYGFHPLETPLTSTSWDWDARSTTAVTIIDTSAVFGAPAGIKAALVRIGARDSAAWGTDGLYIGVGPSATYWYHLTCPAFGGDVRNWVQGIVPCDANGDFYFHNVASGTNTMDVEMMILGYCI